MEEPLAKGEKMQKNRLRNFIAALLVTALILPLPLVYADNLTFDADTCPTITETRNDVTVTYRSCEDIVYVSNPVDAGYQRMNVYVPEAYYQGGSLNGFSAGNAPIFLPNTVGGYMPGPPATVDMESVWLALAKGYVVAAPGARGRSNQDGNGLYTGKAPACIVDLKAAVRYLRYNDEIMPGNAEKIIANGTSAGGALSSLLGTTGNHEDYAPYLAAIGAADERDDIFAASCYCPIQNLDNADTAMEWQFNGIGLDDAEQAMISDDLKAMFPLYLNGLQLKALIPRNDKGVGLKHAPGEIKKGMVLTLDGNGEGSFKDYVKSFVIASAQKALDRGADLDGYEWITIEDGTVTDIDFFGFSADYAGRLPFKKPPAFDALNLGAFENNLFGTATIDNQHFTQYSFVNSKVAAHWPIRPSSG